MVFNVLSLDLHILKLDLLAQTSFRMAFIVAVEQTCLEPTFGLEACIPILWGAVEVDLCGSSFDESLLHLEHLSLALMVHFVGVR
jgi:hypothetical protein